MLDHNEIETVDAEPVLALDTTVEGLPAGLPAHLAAELAELLEDAERYAAAAQAINTTRAYASDWKQFQAWCERYRLESLPASAAVIGLHVTSLAKRGLAVTTIRRRAAAIARAHRQAGHLPATSDPRVLTVMEGIARVHGSAPHKKTAMLRDPLLDADPSSSHSQSRTSPPPRWPAVPDRALKDRPARPRPGAPGRLRRAAAAVPGPGAARLDRHRRAHRRPDLSARDAHRRGQQPPHGPIGRADHQETRARRRT